MNLEELKTDIIHELQALGLHGVLFPSLTIGRPERAGIYAVMKGPLICLWAGMSMPMVDAILELSNENRILCVPVNEVVYQVKGATLTLPVLRKWPTEAEPLKEMHWLPAAITVLGA